MSKQVMLAIKVLLPILILMLPGGEVLAGWIVDGAPVCLAGGDQSRPCIVPSGSGGAIIAWEDRRTLTDIYAQRLDEMGRTKWTINGIAVCNAENNQDHPQILEDGSGGAFIVWDDHRDYVQADIYIQHADSNGTMLWDADGREVCTETGDQEGPVICSDGAGGCIIAWLDDRNSLNADVYAQRLDGSGTALWTAGGIAVCVNDTIQADLQIISDGSGGAVMTWADYRGSDIQIFGQRVNSTGAVQWAVDGVRLAPSNGPQYDHKIAMDADGGAYVTWTERRPSTFDICLQRVTSSGSEAFATGGIVVCGLGETQRYSEIIADGTGGAIVIWEDFRTTLSDLYAQRFDEDGNTLWPAANGTPVCTYVPGDIFFAVSYPDGTGGAIIIWSDNRNAVTNGMDVYAQRIDASGTALWDTDGRAFCAAPGAQDTPCVTTNGNGGVIVGWRDRRDSEFDIYAQMITDEGTIVPTLLQDFYSTIGNGAVRITWQLAEVDEPVDFFVSRIEVRSGRRAELSGADIKREGLLFSFIDESFEPDQSYVYRIDVCDKSGRRLLFETEPVNTPAVQLYLSQNYPNPFNPATTICYSIPERCRVTLSIYDVTGKLVLRLFNRMEDAGSRSIHWNGTDANGNPLPSGIYSYRLSAGGKTVSRKMTLIR